VYDGGSGRLLQISVTAGSTITVTLSFSDSVCNIELLLLTAAFNQVDISNGASNTESVTYTTSSSQTMYVRVYTFDLPSPSAYYTMTISTTSPPPAVPGYDVLLLVVALVSTAGVLAIVLRKRRV
jgi:hypothetical protein